MRFFSRDMGKMAILKRIPWKCFKMAIFPVSRGEKSHFLGDRVFCAHRGVENDYTHCIIWEWLSQVHIHMAFWQEFFCVTWAPMKVLSVNGPITHISGLGINCPIAHISVTQKNCFWIVCVIMSGHVVLVQRPMSPRTFRAFLMPQHGTCVSAKAWVNLCVGPAAGKASQTKPRLRNLFAPGFLETIDTSFELERTLCISPCGLLGFSYEFETKNSFRRPLRCAWGRHETSLLFFGGGDCKGAL